MKFYYNKDTNVLHIEECKLVTDRRGENWQMVEAINLEKAIEKLKRTVNKCDACILKKQD